MHQSELPRGADVTRRLLDALLVLVFAAVSVAPSVDWLVRPDSARSPELRERRRPSVEPAAPDSLAALTRYPAQYEAYFKDNLGLRDQLLRWNSIVKIFALGSSPSPIAYFGKEGWVFYTGANTRENHRGLLRFSEVELRNWADALERKRRILESLGVEYLYVIAPDKETVYPEMLPEFMRPIGPTLREQLLAHMSAHAPQVEILDLTDALTAAKRADAPDDWTYGNLGTHWSGRGAQVALKAMLARLDSMVGGFHPSEIDAFERVEIHDDDDSWTTRMYVGDLLRQVDFGMRPTQPLANVHVEGNRTLGRIRKSWIEGSTRPRVLFVHDSFGPYVEDGLAEQCAYLECRWGRTIDTSRIRTVKPLVLVDLHVERALNTMDPRELVPIEETYWAQRFERSEQRLVVIDDTREDWGFSAVGSAAIGPAASTPKPRLPITVNAPEDLVAFPAFVPLAGETAVLHIAIDSPMETEIALSHSDLEAANPPDGIAHRLKLRPGSNEFHLPLDQPGAGSEMRMKLGAPQATYLLRKFEIRSVRAD